MGRASKETFELIQDLSGGLNTLASPNRLPAQQSPTLSNVWYDDGAIQKRPGQFKVSTVGGGDTLLGRAWFGYETHTSVLSGSQYCVVYGSLGVGKNLLLSVPASGVTTSTLLTTAKTGTVSTAVASPIVTGVGTNFTSSASIGSVFAVGNTVGIVQSVDSDTQVTLTANFGALNSGTASFSFSPGWPSTNRVSFAEMNSKTWVCGQGQTPVSWDGNNLAFVGAFPQAHYSLSAFNYIFAANTSTNPSRVYWSALKDPTSWPATNFVDVSPDDGFPIVGMFYDGQSIVILKTNKAWKLTGTAFDPANPTYSLTPIYVPSDFVINSPRSVQLLSGGFIMLGQKGFYSYNGSGAISKIFDFDRIRSEFANIAAFNWGNVPTVTAEPASIMVDGNYWLQVPYSLSTISSADKELTYVIDKTGAIWKWQATANGMISDFAYLNGTLYGVNSYSGGTPGFIQLNTGTSDAQTTAIAGTITTKVYEFQNQQRFGRANVYFKKQSSGNLTFSYQVDESGFVSNTIDMTSSPVGEGGTRVKSVDIVIGSVGRTIQFQLSNSVAAQTFEVYGIEFYHRDLEN